MEATRVLRRVGGSTMLPIPPEALAEAGLALGDQVLIRSQPGRLEVTAVRGGPDPDLASFAKQFTEQYHKALRELADR